MLNYEIKIDRAKSFWAKINTYYKFEIYRKYSFV